MRTWKRTRTRTRNRAKTRTRTASTIMTGTRLLMKMACLVLLGRFVQDAHCFFL